MSSCTYHQRTQGPATLGTGPGSRRHTLVAARVACVSPMHILVRRKRIAVSWPPPEWGKANTLCLDVYLAQAPLNFWVRHWHLPYSPLDRVIKRWNHKLGGRIEGTSEIRHWVLWSRIQNLWLTCLCWSSTLMEALTVTENIQSWITYYFIE